MSWPLYLRCFVSCPLDFNCSHVVLFTVLPSVPRFHPACIIFDSPLRSYSTIRKYNKPYLLVVFDYPWVTYSKSYLRTLGRGPRDTLVTDFIRLGSVTTNRKNGLTGEQLVVGTDSRSVNTGPSRMFSVLTEGCLVVYSRKFQADSL